MSKVMSWEEYVKRNISHFRAFNEARMISEYKDAFATERWAFLTSLFPPCQVVVLDFGETYPTSFLVVHNSKKQDMDTIILENLNPKNLTFQDLKKRLLDLLSSQEIQDIHKIIGSIEPRAGTRWISSWMPLYNSALVMSRDDPRTENSPNALSMNLTEAMNFYAARYLEDKQRAKIEETVSSLRKDAEAIPKDFDFRDKIIETTARLEAQVEQLNKKVDEEIGGVRRLVGTTKDFQDFRVFTTDVTDLKKSHVPREVFDSEIKRLEQKIDSMKEIIASMKEIKFWSKNNILIISLAIIATASTLIAALLAAHII